ncbi:MAG: methyltransferase domain-containing protein [Solirubrobacterales bacterium]
MSASGRYLLGDSPAEIRHLVEQAELYAYEANELFDLIGVAADTTAIDMGCGVLGVLHLIAERVGADGRVVGLDREARMVEFGRQLAEQRGLAVEFIQADATATGLPDRTFDLVHARTLLLNVQNPEQILTEMVRIARPGGCVAVQEPDASAWNCDPPHPAFDILRGAILSAYRRTGKDFNIGRRIPRMLKEVGLDEVDVRPTARVTRAGEYYQTFLLTVASLVRDVIVQAGELTADEFESYTAALRAHLEAPGTITCQPLMWQAWGRATTATGAS